MSFEQVRVWCAATNVEVDSDSLSAEELSRASSFRFDHDRIRWIAARVLLRRVLGSCLGVAPARLKFSYSSHGKPLLADNPLRFNLSHSGDLAVCAIAERSEIGIDIERVRTIENIEAIFRSISSPREYAAFLGLPNACRTTAFFEAWTVKEACLKASGTGLSQSPAAIEVLPVRDVSRPIESESHSWLVVPFRPHQRYAAALALCADTSPKNFNEHFDVRMPLELTLA